MLGRYLVLSPKGHIADVGGEVRTARPGGPRTPAARGATPRPGEAATGAGAPSAPAARSPRAKPPPGGERPAPRRPRAGGWEPCAEPGPAPPPSPPAPRPAPARALPRGSPGGSPSEQEPCGRPGSAPSPRAAGVRPPGTLLPSPSPGSSLGSSQLPASVSHARPEPAARRLPGDSCVPAPRGPRLGAGPGRVAARPGSTPRRAASPGARSTEPPRVQGERKEARGTVGAGGDAALHSLGEAPVRCRPSCPPPRPLLAPRPAGPARGRGRSAAAGRAGTVLPELRDGARAVLVSPRRLGLREADGAAGGRSAAQGTFPGKRAAGAGPPERFCI